MIMTPPWFQECIYWMTPVIWRHILEPIWREHLKRSICQGHCVYFTTLVTAIHIITSGLWSIREKLNVCLRKTIVALLSWRCLFIPIHSYLFEKWRTKCMEVLAATPLFVGECVNLQFHNSNCSYCRHLHLQGWLTEQLLSPKNCSFRVLIALTFFCGAAVLGTATVKRIYLKHQIFAIFCMILMRIFQNSPKKLHINSGSEKIASPRFHAVSFVC